MNASDCATPRVRARSRARSGTDRRCLATDRTRAWNPPYGGSSGACVWRSRWTATRASTRDDLDPIAYANVLLAVGERHANPRCRDCFDGAGWSQLESGFEC
jgi:hypothetical protein